MDEAGRGPLAGPVVAAAVVFAPEVVVPGVADSKALTADERESLVGPIRSAALGFGVGVASPAEIDELNILQATFLAMHRALAALASSGVTPEHLLIDGNRYRPADPTPFATLVRGDSRSQSIAAASILAKVTRDGLMVAAEAAFPGYGFARHKGYPTAAHYAALARLGPCPLHRRSFRLS